MVCWEWESWGEAGGWPPQHPLTALSVFWVQVLVAGLIVPLSLGAALIYTYRCCQPHKPMIPGKSTDTAHKYSQKPVVRMGAPESTQP